MKNRDKKVVWKIKTRPDATSGPRVYCSCTQRTAGAVVYVHQYEILQLGFMMPDLL